MDFSIVIPAYNEASRIGRVIPAALGVASEVLVIDDGSSDATAEVARALGARVVSHDVNKGKGAAILTGLREARFDSVVLMDGDGQHDPHEAVALMRKLDEGFDLVVGDRFSGPASIPLPRWVANRVIQALVSVRTGVGDPLSGFRALRRSKFKGLREAGYETEMEMVFYAARNGLKVSSVPISVRYGVNPNPKTNLAVYLKLLSFALRGG
jgi:glycosyltransferase involved in cell wall biosynthesis